MDDIKVVYMQAYKLAEQYTKGFFAGTPAGGKFMKPELYDSIQGVIFNTYVDAYNKGAKDMEEKLTTGKLTGVDKA